LIENREIEINKIIMKSFIISLFFEFKKYLR